MANLAEFRAEIDQCRVAMAAQDYASARRYLATARVTLVAIPDTEMAEERLTWQRQLDTLSQEIQSLEQGQNRANACGPIVFSQIRQVRSWDEV